MRLLEDGLMIGDTYEVERFLGEGAFAEVYRVKHRFLGRQAMKVFKRVGMNIEEIHEMLGEAILLSRLAHPNIVRVFDANILETPRGTCGYFTMENVPGGTLHKFWQSYGTQSGAGAHNRGFGQAGLSGDGASAPGKAPHHSSRH